MVPTILVSIPLVLTLIYLGLHLRKLSVAQAVLPILVGISTILIGAATMGVLPESTTVPARVYAFVMAGLTIVMLFTSPADMAPGERSFGIAQLLGFLGAGMWLQYQSTPESWMIATAMLIAGASLPFWGTGFRDARR